ncbi:uncharacterized protein Dana_GF10600 [Drosophila ananassae]|uniref:Uncharacterized protein n=1 Tax=Drosophila ananassae TaxID=7217 RepID=B3M5C5_DROAN|nr:uncharacterized protein LOC6493469 [Drosophila ananassae]EDV40630.2 uncharacterized protein Dana_GF10600 [Drosophila ananassae]
MKFLFLCTLLLSVALFMAAATSKSSDNAKDDHSRHHQVVRSLRFAADDKTPPKHDDVACCG